MVDDILELRIEHQETGQRNGGRRIICETSESKRKIMKPDSLSAVRKKLSAGWVSPAPIIREVSV
jgi:hypothetical protein